MYLPMRTCHFSPTEKKSEFKKYMYHKTVLKTLLNIYTGPKNIKIYRMFTLPFECLDNSSLYM